MKKVMIIDDNETNLKIMDLVLSKAGFKTDTIINPKYAFDIINESRPDVILLDINMPEINGFQLCKMLKKDPELQYIPVIFVSSLDMTEYIAGGLALGAVDYITKPIKADELVARVSIQYRIAYNQKKLRKTNENLTNELTEIKIENSDMQEDLLYSLIKLKQGEENPNHYIRIKDFCTYIVNKIIKDSQYKDELNEDFVIDMLKESFLK